MSELQCDLTRVIHRVVSIDEKERGRSGSAALWLTLNSVESIEVLLE